jgi:uncharacterized protein (DUF362 family)
MKRKKLCHGGKMKHHENMMTRRDFIALSGLVTAGVTLTGYTSLEGNSLIMPASKKARVAVAKVTAYDKEILRREIREMFDNIGGLGDIIKPGSRVVIKANLTGGLKFSREYAENGINTHWTHPEIVRAVGEALIDAGAKELFITEALYEDATFDIAGYIEMADALGARLIDLEKPDPFNEYIHKKVGTEWLLYEEFIFNRLVCEADAFISIAKLKCHGTCGVTLALKNHIGLAPVRYYCSETRSDNRSGMHGSAEEQGIRLPKTVVDMLRARPIDLAVIDGIKTAEGGEGPWIRNTFRAVEPGVIIAGKNPVATDSVSTAIMGFNPDAADFESPFDNSLNHLALARQKGLGTNLLDEIEVVGTKIDEVIHPFTPCPKRT